MKRIYLATLFAMTIGMGSAFAQTAHTEHKNGADSQMQKSPATIEFEKAMDQMHKPMMEGIMDSDPDVAFVKGMIPHHEGAVEMAKTVLKYGKDPEIRQLAENVIRDQDKEIKMMQDWLEKQNK